MISLKPVFYSKVGNHTDGQGLVYKYYLGSVDPHFYFSGYIVPNKNTFDFFYIPQVNNILNNGIVDMSVDSANAIRNVVYGEEVQIVLANPHLNGYGRVINVKFSIDEAPVAVNSTSVDFADFEKAIKDAKIEIEPITDIKLYTLSNIMLIEVEAKLNNILESSVGVNQDNVVPTIIGNILSVKSTFVNNLPDELSDTVKEKLYDLYIRSLNVAPHSSRVTIMFADTILFARMIVEREINIMSVPYEVLFRLMSDWTRGKHAEHVSLLKKASLAVSHFETIEINMSTVEDADKVYELFNKTQAFVYLTNIKFTNMDTGDYENFPMDNEYYRNYIKSTDNCIESKGIPSSNGTVLLQYGYGIGCDEFIGIFSTDNNGVKRGLRRDNKMVEDAYVVARTWQWKTNITVKIEGEIDSSGNISVEFTGV